MKTLRETSVVKNEQFKILYEEIEKQRTEITLQRHIITCLEYRQALENLPNRKCEAITKKGTDATSLWKAMWKLATEIELENMIKDHIILETPELASEPLSKLSSSRLRPLIKRDFDYWASKKLGQATSLEVARPGIRHDLPHLRRYNPPYQDWSVYQRGLTMYNELSSTIHRYGKSYKVHENVWAISDRLIFEWLKPDIDSVGEVNWDREWFQRGLPPVSSNFSAREQGEALKENQDEAMEGNQGEASERKQDILSKRKQVEVSQRTQDKHFSNSILDTNEDMDLSCFFDNGEAEDEAEVTLRVEAEGKAEGEAKAEAEGEAEAKVESENDLQKH